MQAWKRFLRVEVVVAAFLVVLALSTASFADLAIVTESEGERSEILMKGNRIAIPMGGADKIIVECTRQEVTIVSNQEYWTGSIAEFGKSMQAFAEEVQAEIGQDLGGLLGGLFGGGAAKSEPINVRVTRIGDEKVGQYEATQYKIESGQGSNWKPFETIWVSRDLLNDVRAEIGNCYDHVLDVTSQLASTVPFGMEEMVAVVTHPEYMKVHNQGYVVKSVTTISFLGMSLDVESVVVEVSKNAISEDVFAVPSHYQRIDDPWEVLGN